MNLTSSYYEAEKRYLTPSEMDSKTEQHLQTVEELKDMIYSLENELDELYEAGIIDDDKEWELEELKERLTSMA